MNSQTERRDAYRSIKTDGVAMTLRRVQAGVYDPIDGKNNKPTPEEYSTYGIITDYNLWERQSSLIKAGDKKIVLAAIDTTGAPLPDPIQDDDIDVDGVQWAVVQSITVAPQGVAILYKIQVRR